MAQKDRNEASIMNSKRAHELFLRLEKRLEKCAPDMVAAANSYADEVVDASISDSEKCWSIIWDKPLFANTKVEYAEKTKALISHLMKNAWRNIGKPGGEYFVVQRGSDRKVSSFSIEGALANKIRSFNVAPHRMLAVQGAGKALAARDARNGDRPYRDIVGAPIREIAPTLRAEMGKFWGHVTILHLLTDFGLAVKTDLHLVRTLRVFGLAEDVAVRPVPTYDEAITLVEGVQALCLSLYGDASPSRMRYADKILMEFSRQGLLSDI